MRKNTVPSLSFASFRLENWKLSILYNEKYKTHTIVRKIRQQGIELEAIEYKKINSTQLYKKKKRQHQNQN